MKDCVTELMVHCIDTNECSNDNNNNCNQLCSNTPGSYTCYCNTGYELQSDGATCVGKYLLILLEIYSYHSQILMSVITTMEGVIKHVLTQLGVIPAPAIMDTLLVGILVMVC